MALVEQSARIDTPTIAAQLTQFEKLLALHDEVTAGKHPRVKLASAVPSAASAIVTSAGGAAAALSQAASVSSKPLDKLTTSGSSLLTAAQQSKPVPSSNTRVLNEPATRPRATASDFDPIFLTKSDHLIRAEKRLERERVEKVLKEQLQSRKLAEKREIEQQDALPDFDVSEVLQQAQELVKPLLASEVIAANVSGSASDSIDNHTLYSSQAESEPEDRADLRATKPCRYFFVEGRCRKGDRCDWSHDSAFKRKMQDPQATEGNSRDVESDSQQRGPERHSRGRNGNSSGQAAEDGEIDEGSYSPPRAPPVPLTHDDIQQRQSGATAGHHSSSKRRVSAHQPPDDGRIIRSHITSPLAPQPSHMSPFVVDKIGRVERVAAEPEAQPNISSARTARAQYVDTAGQISSSDSIVVTKKRRRGASPTDAHRNVAPRRPLAASPLIKAEPVSPAPLAQYAVRQYADVEEVPSPAVYRPTHVRRPSGYDSARERVYVEIPDSYRVMTPSRRVVTGPVPYERREPELRRIVSARPPEAYAEHYERNPAPYSPRMEPPTEYFSMRRPVSRANVVDIDPPPPPVYRASMQPQPTYLRPSSSVGPVQYSPPQREARMAARRIVMDQFGNRYYEAPVDPGQRTSYSMVPEAPARTYEYSRAERGYEHYRRASPEPTSPGYVAYREIQPPPPTAPPVRTSSRALSHVQPLQPAQAIPPSMPGSVVYEQGVDGGYRARTIAGTAVAVSGAGGREREREREPREAREPRDVRTREYEANEMPPPPPLRSASVSGMAREREREREPRVARRYYEPEELEAHELDRLDRRERSGRYLEQPLAQPQQAQPQHAQQAQQPTRLIATDEPLPLPPRYYTPVLREARDLRDGRDPRDQLRQYPHQQPQPQPQPQPQIVYTRRAYVAEAPSQQQQVALGTRDGGVVEAYERYE